MVTANKLLPPVEENCQFLINTGGGGSVWVEDTKYVTQFKITNTNLCNVRKTRWIYQLVPTEKRISTTILT